MSKTASITGWSREVRRRRPDWRKRPSSVDGWDNTTRLERGPLGSGGDVVVGDFAHRGEATPGARHRRRAEQTPCVTEGMAGSALTSTPLRKAPYRTERCPTLEAVPRENPTYGILGRAAGNVAHGGSVNPPCNRKGRAGNPPPTGARASALPDPLVENSGFGLQAGGPAGLDVSMELRMIRKRDFARRRKACGVEGVRHGRVEAHRSGAGSALPFSSLAGTDGGAPCAQPEVPARALIRNVAPNVPESLTEATCTRRRGARLARADPNLEELRLLHAVGPRPASSGSSAPRARGLARLAARTALPCVMCCRQGTAWRPGMRGAVSPNGKPPNFRQVLDRRSFPREAGTSPAGWASATRSSQVSG